MTNPNPAVTFLQEADDLLVEIETAALSINTKQSNKEAVDHIFRAFHTIKGSGAMFGFDQVAAFTHHVETLLDQVRDGLVAVTENLSNLILAAGDHIKLLLQAAQGGPAIDAKRQAALLEVVRQLVHGEQASVPSQVEVTKTPEVSPSAWNIEFHPDPTLLSRGGNPSLLFRDLKTLGLTTIQVHTDRLPSLTDLDPEICYFWWTIHLESSCSESEIQDVFLFAQGDSELVITPAADLTPAPSIPADSTSEPSDLNPQLSVPTLDSAQHALTREATVRVPAERLDRLVTLVGELVMNQSRLARAAHLFQSAELAGPVEEIDRLVSELRDDVLQIRMMPIASIFGRFRRLVRDLSQQLGKEIELVTEGEETELDKSILDQLGEPLVHLVRNSIDHGIELPADRLSKAKSSRGTIWLTASHRGSDVVVKIEDDGAGLNRDAIRAKAISKQLIAPDANLSDKEILNLILLPGFSTAQSITSISGRGVGMDVVKRQIDALRGSLTLTSEPGKGTCITLTLPLTLAIIDGLLVELGDSQYILPMAQVTENVELCNADRLLNNGRNIVAVRGELIPYIDLRSLFQTDGDLPPLSKIVLVQYEGIRVGLVVDRVLGTHQTVIQALGRFFRNIGVVSGSTVMGDGRVALILDIAAIVNLASRAGQVKVVESTDISQAA